MTAPGSLFESRPTRKSDDGGGLVAGRIVIRLTANKASPPSHAEEPCAALFVRRPTTCPQRSPRWLVDNGSPERRAGICRLKISRHCPGIAHGNQDPRKHPRRRVGGRQARDNGIACEPDRIRIDRIPIEAARRPLSIPESQAPERRQARIKNQTAMIIALLDADSRMGDVA